MFWMSYTIGCGRCLCVWFFYCQEIRSTTICCKSMVMLFQYHDNNSGNIDDHSNISKNTKQPTIAATATATTTIPFTSNHHAFKWNVHALHTSCFKWIRPQLKWEAKKKICAALFSVTMRYYVHTVHKTYIHTCMHRRKMREHVTFLMRKMSITTKNLSRNTGFSFVMCIFMRLSISASILYSIRVFIASQKRKTTQRV